jgi:flagellar basal-body rod protein FlgF
LAIFGPGLLQLRAGEDLVFARGGSFRPIDGGLLADAAGRVLQQAGGGDLVTGGGAVEILDDATVLEDGLPIGTLAMIEAEREADIASLGGSLFAVASDKVGDAASSQLRAGFVEESNVVLSDEMVGMMAAIRQAEGGARMVQFYNQLIGQAVQTFSRSGR